MTQQCALEAQKTSSILACIKRGAANRPWVAILPLCYALMRPHLEYFVQVCSPSAQERHGSVFIGVNTEHQDDKRDGTLSQCRQAETAVGFQPGEEKAPVGPRCNLPIPKGVLQKGGIATFCTTGSDRTKGYCFKLNEE